MTHLANRINHFDKTDIISRIQSLESEEVISACLFGSYCNDSKIKQNQDIDILFIVKPEMKSSEIAFRIFNVFRDYGNVRFHPDFYSTRKNLTFEIIVLPQHSNYFMNLGVMTGLNAFVINKTELVFGNKIHDLIGLPSPNTFSKLEKRLESYHSAHYGINHMLAEIFSRLTKESDSIDLKKLFKIILLDYVWMKTNEFKNTIEELVNNINNGASSSIKNLVNSIFETHNTMDYKIFINSTYELLVEIKKEIKADNKV